MTDRDVFGDDIFASGDEGGQAYGTPCLNCGRHRRDVAEHGGWCGTCSGEAPAYDPQVCVDATRKMAVWAAASPRIRRQKAEVERLWAEYQKSRKPAKPKFGRME